LHPYTLLLAIASLVSAASAGALFLQGRERRANQLAGLLFLGSWLWAICLALCSVTTDLATARAIHRASAPGRTFIAPLVLHIAMEVTGVRSRRLGWLRNALYAVGAGMLALDWATPWLIMPVRRASWGFEVEAGPLLVPVWALNMFAMSLATIAVHRGAAAMSEADRRQLPWIAVVGAIPVAATTLSDVVLPVLGIPFPSLGPVGLSALGALAVWIGVHFGYSFMTPGFPSDTLRLLPDGVAMLRPDGRIRTANEGLARLAGQSVRALEGLPVCELLTWSFDTDSPEDDEVDCELLTAGGGRVPVAVSSAPLRDRQAHALGRVVVVRDLREVADLRHRLVTSARLAAVGELAAGIAHEINNPLAFVRSNLSQLEARWKEVRGELERAGRAEPLREAFGEVDELLSDSLEGIDRAAEIVRGVRHFAHPGSDRSEREPVDLHALLEDALRLIAPQLRGRAEIERDFGALPAVHGSPQQIRQVFVNLLLNASQAIAPGGRIRVATRQESSRAVVVVEDDGAGIAPEIIGRIFDPFFTTKPVGEGTGLGLGIAYQIVRSHGGAIRVDSAPGRGARFRVELPIG
jgi:signal transduction histidine kinase